MSTPHDHEPQHPVPTAAQSDVPRGTGVGATTGILLSRFGERLSQPRPRPAPPRRALLPTAADPDAEPPMVLALLERLAAADPEAPARAHAIARYATALAKALAPAAEVQRIHRAALLCNIGMAEVPAAIVQQTATLTPEERQQIRRHPIHGAELLHEHAALADLILPVLHHHEDYDGGGYPYGLSADWIPLGARIIRVAETYDALLQPRPYRPALSPDEALETLHGGVGGNFDPRCVAALEAYLAQG